MKRGWQWPVLVTLALGFTVGVNFVMLYAAKADPNGTVVEPEYYRKAVEWDRTMARREASAALRWTARASITASQGASIAPSDDATTEATSAEPVATRRVLRVALTDSIAAAITDADVTATLIHNREASTPLVVALQANERGYVVALPALRSGLWEVRLVARRGGERFESTLHAESP